LYWLIERPLLCRVHSRALDADPEDVLLFDNLLGIADPKVELPKIEAYYARRVVVVSPPPRAPQRSESGSGLSVAPSWARIGIRKDSE
jgi:hypothetical protein